MFKKFTPKFVHSKVHTELSNLHMSAPADPSLPTRADMSSLEWCDSTMLAHFFLLSGYHYLLHKGNAVPQGSTTSQDQGNNQVKTIVTVTEKRWHLYIVLSLPWHLSQQHSSVLELIYPKAIQRKLLRHEVPWIISTNRVVHSLKPIKCNEV